MTVRIGIIGGGQLGKMMVNETTTLGFEVVVALGLSTQLLGWQNILGPGGWPLAAVPTVAVWIIVFSSVMPLPPAQHLIGILLASLGVPVAFFTSLSLFEVPPEVGPEQNLRVFLQLVVPTFIASAIAVRRCPWPLHHRLLTPSRYRCPSASITAGSTPSKPW